MIERVENLAEPGEIARLAREMEILRNFVDEAAESQRDRLCAMPDDVYDSHDGAALEANIDQLRSISDHLGELAELVSEVDFKNGDGK